MNEDIASALTNRLMPVPTLANPHKHTLKPIWHALQGRPSSSFSFCFLSFFLSFFLLQRFFPYPSPAGLLSTEWSRLYCRGWLKYNLFTNIARHNSNAYNRPWIAIALVVKEEVRRLSPFF
jgi:hypothetical protein